MKARTLRLPDGLSAVVETVARVDEVTVSELVREAVADYVAARCQDPEFRERLRLRIDTDAALLLGGEA